MSSIKRPLGIVVLCFFLTGCTGSRNVSWNHGNSPAEHEIGSGIEMREGMKVRASLHSGEVRIGIVRGWNDREIILETGSPEETKLLTIRRDEVRGLESLDSAATTAAFVLAGLSLVVIMIVVAASAGAFDFDIMAGS